MADFDKIKINGVPYNVKDTATAQAVAQVERDLANTKETVQQQGQQISQQGQQITQQGQQITQQGQQITQQGQQITQQGQQITQQGQQIAQLDQQIGDISRIRGLVCMGDSYGIGSGSSGDHTYTSWADLLQTWLGLDSQHFYNACVGGAAMSRTGVYYIGAQAATAAANVSPENISHVIIAAGYNEADTITDSNVQDTIQRTRQAFPNSVIVVAEIGFGTDYIKRGTIYNNALPAYQKATRFGAIYATNSQYLFHNYDELDADGIHPNNSGQMSIATGLANALRSGTCDTTSILHTYQPASLSNNRTLHNFQFYIKQDRADITIMPIPAMQTPTILGTFSDFTANAWNELATFETPICRGFESPAYNSFPAVGTIQVSGSSYVNLSAMLGIANGKLYILPLTVQGADFVQPSTWTAITLTIGTVKLNTMFN